MTQVRVRTLQRHDIPAIREICVATGRMRPSQAPTPWIFARYWTDYYTRYEPSHTLVALDSDARVIGYLTACHDTRTFRKRMKRSVLPSILMRAVVSGAMAHPASRTFIVKRLSAWAAPEPDPPGLLDRYPAHIHMNILKEWQGKGAGQALMNRFLAQARQENIPGVYLETLSSNMQACRFFIRAGFKEYARLYPFRKLDPSQAERAVIVYTRKI